MTELGHSALILQKWVSEWVSEWVSKSLSDKSRNRAASAAKNLIAQLIYELSFPDSDWFNEAKFIFVTSDCILGISSCNDSDIDFYLLKTTTTTITTTR